MIRRISSILALAAISGAAALALAACGSSSSSATSTPATAPTSAATAAATAAPTAAATTAATAAASPTTAATTPAAGGGATQAVAVTEKDFAISLAQNSAPAGQITFNVDNTGPSEHELVVIKTDLAPDQLPVDPDVYAVNVNAAGLTVEGQATNIAGGATATLNLNLAPGRYVLICNLPAHYQQGMHVGFVVQ